MHCSENTFYHTIEYDKKLRLFALDYPVEAKFSIANKETSRYTCKRKNICIAIIISMISDFCDCRREETTVMTKK